MNRRERRIQQSKQAKLAREISRPSYSPIKDPEFLKGIATTVHGVEFAGLDGGLCLLRALTAVQALRNCNVDASLHIGAMLCRVGPDPIRDVVAFCGPGNAGYGPLFHAWAEVDDQLLDFSVGDWRRLDGNISEITLGEHIEPIQWAVPLPEYWCKPRSVLVDPWRANGTPALGEAWYGPYNGDVATKAGEIRKVVDEVMPMIADAVEKVVAGAAAQQGIPRPTRSPQPAHVHIIVETANAPTAAPRGMMEIKLSEVFVLAGIDCGEMPDAVGYATGRPTTREQARALLMKMSLTVPR